MTPLVYEPLAPKAAALKNPLALAYLGDTVWDLLIRSRLLLTDTKAGGLHKQASQRVNAGAQAQAFEAVLPRLTEQEADVARRAKNAHSRHSAPKHQDPYDYARASALEAVLGFLALSGQEARARELFDIAMRILYNEGCDAPDEAAKEETRHA